MDRELCLTEEMTGKCGVEEEKTDSVNAEIQPQISEQPAHEPMEQGEQRHEEYLRHSEYLQHSEYLRQIASHVVGNDKPLTAAGWIGVNLAMLIPPLNVLLLFLWAGGGTSRTNLKNYARGVLLTAVLLVLIFLTAVVITDLAGMPMPLEQWKEAVGNLFSA